MSTLSLGDLGDGDRISVVFKTPVRDPDLGEVSEAEGDLRRIVGLTYLIANSLRKPMRMAPCLDLDADNILSLHRLQTASEIKCARKVAARGDVVFTKNPLTARDIEEQLSTLAEMTLQQGDDRTGKRRKEQLKHQFNDIADLVEMAKTKRNYIFARARLDVDFNPWTWPDDRVYRNETVRPLPSDFEIDPLRRKDRPRRLDEAVRIFGEAEREVRRIASHLRARGFDVRRPHPNAQELRVRMTSGKARADFTVSCSKNGLWEISQTPPQNKTQTRALQRVLRSGAQNTLTDVLSNFLAVGV